VATNLLICGVTAQPAGPVPLGVAPLFFALSLGSERQLVLHRAVRIRASRAQGEKFRAVVGVGAKRAHAPVNKAGVVAVSIARIPAPIRIRRNNRQRVTPGGEV